MVLAWSVLTADGSCVLLKKRHTGAPHNYSWGDWWWPAISHIQPLPALGRASSHPSSPAVAGYLHCYRVANCPSKAYPQMKLQGPLRPGLGVCAIPSTASSWTKASPGSMEVKEGLWSLGLPHAGFSRPHCVTAVFLKNVFSVSFFFFPFITLLTMFIQGAYLFSRFWHFWHIWFFSVYCNIFFFFYLLHLASLYNRFTVLF